MKIITISTFVVSLCLSSFVFSASHSQSSGLSIDHPWARTSAPGAPSAGFLTIHNGSDQDETLLAVSGDFAKRLEVHQSFMADGVMKMEEQKQGVLIPAGETVVFEPGSYHLMFMGLGKNFEKGEVYSVTLTFEHAGEVELDLPVMEKKMGAMKH